MSKFVFLFLVVWFCLTTAACFAAHSAGLKDPVEVIGWGVVQTRKAIVRLDTINTALTLMTPTGSNRICVVGAYWLEDHATTITFMSGSTDEWVNIYDANQGFSHAPSADSLQLVKDDWRTGEDQVNHIIMVQLMFNYLN